MTFKVVATALAALVVSALYVAPAEAQGNGRGNYGWRAQQQQLQAREMARKQMRRDMARQQQGFGNGFNPNQVPYYGAAGGYPADQYSSGGYDAPYGAYDPYAYGSDPNQYYPSSPSLLDRLSGLGGLTGSTGLAGLGGLSQLGNLGGLGQLGSMTGLGRFGNSTGVDQYGNPLGYDQYGLDQSGALGGLNNSNTGTASGVIQGLLGLF